MSQVSEHFAEVANHSRASQGRREIYWLLNFVQSVLGRSPEVIVELGVHLGYSVETWSEAWPLAAILGVDIERVEHARCDFLLGNTHLESTQDTVRHWLSKRGPLDFLFIDGDHTLVGVQDDYLMYSGLVRSGGVVAFHDACYLEHPQVEVHKFVDDLPGVVVYQADHNGVAVKVM